MPDVQPVHDWVYVLIVAVPAFCTLVGVVFQARKTRDRGTAEHLMARDMLVEHGSKLDAIQADVKDVKADVRELKATDREHGERLEHLEHPAHIHRAGGRG